DGLTHAAASREGADARPLPGAAEPAEGRRPPRSIEAAGARPLPGAIRGADRTVLAAELASVFGARGAERLLRTYGRLAEELLAAARARPELASPCAPDAELLRAELVRAFEAEWAESLVDLLQRRTMLGLGPDFGAREARAAARVLVELGRWDEARAADELTAYGRFAAAHRAIHELHTVKADEV